MSAFRVAVLASGTGTNLQAIIDRLHRHDGVEVAAVASNKPGAMALERAQSAGISTRVFDRGEHPDRAAKDRAIADWLEAQGVELIVLAGYMELLSAGFVRRFRNRIVNVHPALLPSFPGLDAVGQALEHGVRVTGVTIHFVDEGVDSGPIILQRAIEVPYTRDRSQLEQEIHRVEHELLPEAIRMIAAGVVSVDAHNPRLVHLDEQ